MKAVIDEDVVPGKRLGRHIEHDERSRAFAFGAVMPFEQMRSVVHRRYGSVLNQGNLGSCTGEATIHAINTKGLHKFKEHTFKQNKAVEVYSLATQLDEFDGTYPPEDTGSSGLAAAKAAQQLGLITSYRHAFSVMEALTALQLTAVITGVDWYEGFDTPDDRGTVSIGGQIRGGHEFCILGFEKYKKLDDCLLICQNSWGYEWGRHGQFQLRVKDWDTLLSQRGDCTILERT